MAGDTLRSVGLERVELGRYQVRNTRGGVLSIGTRDEDFSPVELLLAALAACGAIDVDRITSRRCEPDRFAISVTADKVRDADVGNHLENLRVTFTVTFPDGEAGDAARAALPRAVSQSHDRLCTVGRTVELASPVTSAISSS